MDTQACNPNETPTLRRDSYPSYGEFPIDHSYNRAAMKLKVIVQEAGEGGYWAEVPSIPGCGTQGETFEELLQNIYDAVEGCLSVDVSQPECTT